MFLKTLSNVENQTRKCLPVLEKKKKKKKEKNLLLQAFTSLIFDIAECL